MKITHNFRCKKCGTWNKENMDIDMSPIFPEPQVKDFPKAKEFER